MIAERRVKIRNSLGMHVRPATGLAEAAGKFRSHISLIKDGQAVNAKSSIDLLTISAVVNAELVLRAEGDDAEEAVETLAGMIASGFGEN